MTTIDEIREQSKTVWAVSATRQTGSSTDEDNFSALLKSMRTGGAAGAGSDDGSERTTVTRVLSDGSVVITVYEGSRIVSETKSRSASPEQTPSVLSVRTETSGAASSTAGLPGAALLLNQLQRP